MFVVKYFSQSFNDICKSFFNCNNVHESSRSTLNTEYVYVMRKTAKNSFDKALSKQT